MSLEILTILTVSFCWLCSRAYAPYDAWRDNRVDYGVTVVAVASWLVNTFSIMLTPNLGEQLSAEYNTLGELGLFVMIVAYVALWVILTVAFAKVRVRIGE